MDAREHLVKAQEADALANASENPAARLAWEQIAKQYRELAIAMAAACKAQDRQP